MQGRWGSSADMAQCGGQIMAEEFWSRAIARVTRFDSSRDDDDVGSSDNSRNGRNEIITSFDDDDDDQAVMVNPAPTTPLKTLSSMTSCLLPPTVTPATPSFTSSSIWTITVTEQPHPTRKVEQQQQQQQHRQQCRNGRPSPCGRPSSKTFIIIIITETATAQIVPKTTEKNTRITSHSEESSIWRAVCYSRGTEHARSDRAMEGSCDRHGLTWR